MPTGKMNKSVTKLPLVSRMHWSLSTLLLGGIMAGSLSWADVNLDGNLDVLFANAPKTNQVCFGDGTDVFSCNDIPGYLWGTRGVAVGI